MPQATDEHTGTRIRRARKRRHLTQRELSSISHVSYSTLTKVEQGKLAASPSVIGALARALSIPTTELTGQPYLEELQQDQLDGLIQPIREALDIYDLGADPDVAPRPLDVLAAEAEELCRLVRKTSIKQAGAALPGLIEEVTTAAHAQPSRRAWQVLASTYRTAHDVATKLGYTDLAAIALDRMEWAAERASDAVVAATRQYMRALAYLRAGQYRTGRRLIRMGLSALDQADVGRVRDVVTGQLHLGAAVLDARSKDGDGAEGHLSEAERIAKLTGAAEQVHWLAFGPTNVAVHRVSVLAELDQYPEAVQLARDVSLPVDWPASRMSHHYAEVARVQLWTGRTDAAFRNLLLARRTAPQQARYSPTVRETYAGLESARRQMPESLQSFGVWLGM